MGWLSDLAQNKQIQNRNRQLCDDLIAEFCANVPKEALLAEGMVVSVDYTFAKTGITIRVFSTPDVPLYYLVDDLYFGAIGRPQPGGAQLCYEAKTREPCKPGVKDLDYVRKQVEGVVSQTTGGDVVTFDHFARYGQQRVIRTVLGLPVEGAPESLYGAGSASHTYTVTDSSGARQTYTVSDGGGVRLESVLHILCRQARYHTWKRDILKNESQREKWYYRIDRKYWKR